MLLSSSALSSCHSRVYQSLANLIRWADQVMLDGIDLDDKESVIAVTSVIKAVLDGVKVFFLAVFLAFFSSHAWMSPKLCCISANRNWWNWPLRNRSSHHPPPPINQHHLLQQLRGAHRVYPLEWKKHTGQLTYTGGFCVCSNVSVEVPLVDTEQDVSNRTAPASSPAKPAPELQEEDVAPPKPPLPEAKVAELRWPPYTP